MSTLETDGQSKEHIAGKKPEEDTKTGLGVKRVREDGKETKAEKEDSSSVKKEKERKKCFPWMHPAIVPKTKPGIGGGMGLFCTEFIPEGTVVWRDSEESMEALRYTKEDIEAFPEEEQAEFRMHAYQVDNLTFSGTRIKKGEAPIRDPSEYKNHSCDPNVWHDIDCDTVMTARKDINVGDEVTYDYCTTETENSMHVAAAWKCACGAKECRGRLTGVEYKDPALQKRYARRWAGYIQEKIDAYNKEKEKEKEKEKPTVSSS